MESYPGVMTIDASRSTLTNAVGTSLDVYSDSALQNGIAKDDNDDKIVTITNLECHPFGLVNRKMVR